MNGRFLRQATFALAIAVFLASCGPFAPSTRVTDPTAQTPLTKNQAITGLPSDTKNKDLIYVTNVTSVLIYSFPNGKYLGELKAFKNASGACSDAKGNVFFTDVTTGDIYKYPHGARKPSATYKTHIGLDPFGCAFDSTTGNLAATGSGDETDIFEPGKSKPLVLKDPKMSFNNLCSYDNRGNLYVGGTSNASEPIVEKLSAGRRTFETLALDASVDTSGPIRWDDGRLLMISYGNANHKIAIPRLIQFAVHGLQTVKTGTVKLNKPAYGIDSFAIASGRMVASNWEGRKQNFAKTLLVFDYPAGGDPTAIITKNVNTPRGVAVSLAASAL